MSRPFKSHMYKYPEIAISEQNGVRSLHLGGVMVQSAMNLAAPYDLELFYTQCMMGFLLFYPNPAQILIIGLGGGSLAKFIHHRMPQTETTVIEINPQIIATAYQHFEMPEEDNRLKIILEEGGEYIASHPLSTDILMIDGFDDGCQVSSLCSQEFYNNAYNALNRNGLLVVNLLSQDRNINNYLNRIKNSFNGHVIAMLSEARGNLIVFASKHSPGKLAWKKLKIRAKGLEKAYALPFSRFVSKMHKFNSNRGDYLEI